MYFHICCRKTRQQSGGMKECWWDILTELSEGSVTGSTASILSCKEFRSEIFHPVGIFWFTLFSQQIFIDALNIPNKTHSPECPRLDCNGPAKTYTADLCQYHLLTWMTHFQNVPNNWTSLLKVENGDFSKGNKKGQEKLEHLSCVSKPLNMRS
jgi:hypothetical protein